MQTTQVAVILWSILIRYQSEPTASDRYLIDDDPWVIAIYVASVTEIMQGIMSHLRYLLILML